MSKIRDEFSSMQVDIDNIADQIKWAIGELEKLSKQMKQLADVVDEEIEERDDRIHALEAKVDGLRYNADGDA